jgi:branched-chain amino acid transport system ATP-binding protein
MCGSSDDGHWACDPNGAGKTTLINLLILSPSAGQIFLEGADITRPPPERRVQRDLARSASS